MEDRSKRQRIKTKLISEVVIDHYEYKKNTCSENARIIEKVKESLSISLWFDKHYIIRDQQGDNDGKRDGINAEVVKS